MPANNDDFSFSKCFGWLLVIIMMLPALIGFIMLFFPDSIIRLIGLGLIVASGGILSKLGDYAWNLKDGKKTLRWSHAGTAGLFFGKGIFRFAGGFISGIFMTIIVLFLLQTFIIGGAEYNRSTKINNYMPSPWKKNTADRLINAAETGASSGSLFDDKGGVIATAMVGGLIFGFVSLFKGNKKTE